MVVVVVVFHYLCLLKELREGITVAVLVTEHHEQTSVQKLQRFDYCFNLAIVIISSLSVKYKFKNISLSVFTKY